MTPRPRVLSGRDVVRALRTAGFEVERTRGRHSTLSRRGAGGEKQILTVPLHKELAPGTLRAIYRQAVKSVSPELPRPLFVHD